MLESGECHDFKDLSEIYIFMSNIARGLHQDEYNISLRWQIECKVVEGDRSVSKYAINLHFHETIYYKKMCKVSRKHLLCCNR